MRNFGVAWMQGMAKLLRYHPLVAADISAAIVVIVWGRYWATTCPIGNLGLLDKQ